MKRLSAKTTVGFTLAELLIVIAITSLLALVGIPMYKKSVQKAKKNEAIEGLGKLVTVENAFFAEHGTYGNYLEKIGFILEGTSRVYNMGFPTTACANIGQVPDKTTILGSNLNSNYPSYFDGGYASVYRSNQPVNVCEPGDMPVDGLLFVATATAVLSSKIDASTAKIEDTDTWTIDGRRNLLNTRNGVK